MDDTETILPEFDELQNADTVHYVEDPGTVEALSRAPEREGFVETEPYGVTEKEETNSGEERDPTEHLDPGVQALVHAGQGGERPENWELAGSGSGLWVSDGGKIFNPATGERYSGGKDPESAAVTEEDAVRQWSTGGDERVVIPGAEEKVEGGTMIHAFVLVRGAQREGGTWEVGYEWYQQFVADRKEGEDTGENGENAASAAVAVREKSVEVQAGGTLIDSPAPLYHGQATSAERPENAEAASDQRIEHGPVAQETAGAGSAEVAQAAVPAADAPHVQSEVVEMVSPSAMAAFLKEEPVEIRTDDDAHDDREAAPQASAAEIPAPPEHAGAPEAVTPQETAAKSPAGEPPVSLPIFAPNQGAVPESAVQAMYNALIRSFSGEASASPHPAAETTPDRKTEHAELSAPLDVTSPVQRPDAASRFEAPVVPMRTEAKEPVAEKIDTAAVIVTLKTGPAGIRSPITAQHESRSAHATPEASHADTAAHGGREKVSALVDVPVAVQHADRDASGERPAFSRERSGHAGHPSPKGAEIVSRALGIRPVTPIGTESHMLRIGRASVQHFRIANAPDDEAPKDRGLPSRELHGIRMVATRQ